VDDGAGLGEGDADVGGDGGAEPDGDGEDVTGDGDELPGDGLGRVEPLGDGDLVGRADRVGEPEPEWPGAGADPDGAWALVGTGPGGRWR